MEQHALLKAYTFTDIHSSVSQLHYSNHKYNASQIFSTEAT